MINNSLITSFFASPHTQLTPVGSPILLSPDSLDSLESLSLQEKPASEGMDYLQQRQLSELNSSIVILSECSLADEDRSLLLLEDNTEELLANKKQIVQQKQSTLSSLFQTPPSFEPVECVANRRERRKAAIRASQQMTELLTRSRDTQVEDRNAVAPIFLSTAEKKRMKEQSLEEERRTERIQKEQQEAERIKYEAFLKFATESILNSKAAKPVTPQPEILTSEDLWTSLKHVRQLHTESARSYIPLSVVSSCYPVLDSGKINYDILKVESDERDSLPSLGVVLLTERELKSRVSELAELFPALPVKELFLFYLSLAYPPDPPNAAALSNQITGAEGKKRTRKRDTDNPLSFRSKRRRNQFSPPASKSADCIIVDSPSDSDTPSSSGETVLWTDKLMPPVSSLLLSDAAAVGRMREFLRGWQRGESVWSTDNSSIDTRSKAELADSSDEDFDFFIKRNAIVDEDTRDSLISLDQALSGTMLLTGGVSSGKTSSVYVIAQELGMKVLEINTCMNRSGRDLQLCLSEATQSFTVTAAEMNNKSNSKVLNKKDSNCISYANHFGKLNPNVSQNTILTKPSKESTTVKSKMTLTEDTIILLDEVDLLFEPEKGFWPAFQQIARETKLPIFLTANESNGYEIIPDIFTNHTNFQPITVTKLSLLIHLVFLVQKINIPKSLATDIAIYFWPDFRQIIYLLQFWLTPSTHHSAPNNIKNIERFLSSFVLRTDLFIFNIHTLSSSFIYKVIPKSDSPVKQPKLSSLRIQYRASAVMSSLEVYRSKLMLSSFRSPLTTSKFGDDLSPDTLPDYACSFHQSLCSDLMATQCDLMRRLVHSHQYTVHFKEDYLEGLASEARDFDKKRIWENSLISVSESILEERSNSPRDYGEHYLPYLKSICASEGDRQICNRRRRHFKHYLSSSLSPNQIDSLTESELIN